MPPAASTSSAAERILDALPASFERAPTTNRYRLGIALATLVVVLVPLVYLALVAALSWGVVWFAFHGLVARLQGRVLPALADRAPIVVGALLLLHLIRPLLARSTDEDMSLALEREHEPLPEPPAGPAAA